MVCKPNFTEYQGSRWYTLCFISADQYFENRPQTAYTVGAFRGLLKFLRSGRTGGHKLDYDAHMLGSFITLSSKIQI